jgi:hypothetical protein
MGGGLVGSLVLHVLAALVAIFGLPWLRAVPPPIEQVIPINLVELGETSASPIANVSAPLPQVPATEMSNSPTATAVPAEQSPPSQAAQQQAVNKSAADLSSAVKPQPNPEIRRPITQSDRDALSSAKPHPSPASTTTGELAQRLKQLAQLRQPAAPTLANPRQQNDSGFSNTSAASTAHVGDPVYAVRDFIRAQVERRWYPDRDAAKGQDWVVRIHLVLNPDYSVQQADIVDDPRYQSNKRYRDFAISARNAVLLSSPLTLPPGAYNIAKDIVIDFDARRDLR